jgi:hypothetical protein
MSQSLVLAVSDQAELRSLREWLAETPSARVSQESGAPAAGEQGTLDYVAVVASSGGLIAAIKVLPAFLRARRPELKITMTVRDKTFTVDATNVDDVLPVLEKLIDAE